MVAGAAARPLQYRVSRDRRYAGPGYGTRLCCCSDEGEVWTLPAGGLHRGLFALDEAESAIYLTRSVANHRDFTVQTMVYRGNDSDEYKWEMEVTRDSLCFGAENVCEFKIVHRSRGGSERSYRRILLVQRMPLGQRPDWRLHSF